MTPGDLNQLITSVTSLVAAIGSIIAIILGYLNHMRLQTVSDSNIASDTKMQIITDKVEQVHLATNSMKDQLVAATASASKAEGIAIGRKVGDEAAAAAAAAAAPTSGTITVSSTSGEHPGSVTLSSDPDPKPKPKPK